MSSKTRKIGFYQISLPLTEQDDAEDQDIQEQSPKELMRILAFCNNLRDQDRIMKMENVKKAHHIELIEQDFERNECCIRFISGKYAHCPQIYNVDTAATKESNKTLRDAEKEQTHFVFRIRGEVIYALLEERRNGITITTICQYLKWLASKYYHSRKEEMNYRIEWALIPKGDFEEEFKKLARVSLATISMSTTTICSNALEYAHGDSEVKEEAEIILRSKRQRNIRTLVSCLIPRLKATDIKQIKRMKVVGYDEYSKKSILDTEIIKRMEMIDVELDDTTGTIRSSDELFQHMKTWIRKL